MFNPNGLPSIYFPSSSSHPAARHPNTSIDITPHCHSTSIGSDDGYPPGVQSDPEGTLWRDPPEYWEQIVYPAYVDANRDVFENGDVENGDLSGKVKGLILLESLKMDMNEAVDRCCTVLKEVAKGQ